MGIEDSRIHYPPEEPFRAGEWIHEHEDDYVWDFLEDEGLLESWEDWAKMVHKDFQDQSGAVDWVYKVPALRARFEEFMLEKYEASKEPPDRLGDHE